MTRTHEWAAQNCHMLARREIRRLNAWRAEGGEATPIGMAVTAWEHVLRICEKAGIEQNGVLRGVPMTETRHTPGPWTWFNYPDGRKLLCAPSRAVIHSPDAPMTCESADAALIAAAPDLLNALKLMESVYRRNVVQPGEPSSVLAVVQAAIAKADGSPDSGLRGDPVGRIRTENE